MQDILSIDDSIRQVQIDKINKIKSERDNNKVQAILKTLETKARGTENVMPTILEAVENYATLGEVADVMRGVFGEYVG